MVALALLWQDFGDYQDGYYSVQTTEGEQIAQLIAGYIDIILKKVGLRWGPGPGGDHSEAVRSRVRGGPLRSLLLSSGPGGVFGP